MSTKTKFVAVAVVVGCLLIFGLYFGWFTSGGNVETTAVSDDRGVVGDPVDITIDFYDRWKNARQSTSTDPFVAGLLEAKELSQGMSDTLTTAKGTLGENVLDPVLCQIAIPDSFRVKPIFKQATNTQLIILSSDRKTTSQAIVTLVSHNDRWEITDIRCSAGEVPPPQGEFSFDTEGRLLTGIPEPLDPTAWYLVFDEGGISGHTAPLILKAESMCITKDGTESVCHTDQFSQTTKVHVQGAMTEAGVVVKKITMLE